MKKWLIFLSIFILVISLLYAPSLKDEKNELSTPSSQRKINVLLDIPPRLQWQNSNGYCGSCSIQQIAAYYGSYVSQYICRKILNPKQRKEVLIGLNENTVLDALSFTYEQWNWRKKKKWKKYLVWTKKHLNKGAPVIITTYIKGMKDPDYDHIMPAVGINSSDRNKYHDQDELIFNDNFVLQHRMRTFGSLPDRSYTYALPTRYNYGCAVTGIQDDEGITLPVYLSIDSWDEPNVTRGKSPISLSGKVQISSLTPGKSYLLLRYDDYKDVPSKDFLDSDFSSSTSFVATKETQSFNVQFISDGVAMFRCIPEKRYSIAGKVSTRNAKRKFLARSGLRGVVMQGLPGNPSTDASGRYRAYIDPGWSGTVTPFKASYKFNPSSRDYSNLNVDQRNQNYTASRVQNTLTIQAGTEGSSDPSPGMYEYDYGADVSIAAQPDARYAFDNWRGDASGKDNPLFINMDSDKSITTNFIRQYTLDIDSNTGGTTDPSPGAYIHNEGSEILLTAIPDTQYNFKQWGGDVTNTDNPLTLTLNSDISIDAEFIRIIYPVLSFTGEKVFHRSLSQAEYVNVLKWKKNSNNNGINIAQHRIYLIEGTKQTVLAELDANTFEYWHRKVDRDKIYRYVLMVIDDAGREGEPAYMTVQ